LEFNEVLGLALMCLLNFKLELRGRSIDFLLIEILLYMFIGVVLVEAVIVGLVGGFGKGFGFVFGVSKKKRFRMLLVEGCLLLEEVG
jgi:hypothetical protein